MIELIIGVAIGAAFSKFWIALYEKAAAALKKADAPSDDK